MAVERWDLLTIGLLVVVRVVEEKKRREEDIFFWLSCSLFW